ncbi:MAG: erythromycin esterase family protein [Cytophagales bacterium]|jgi:erythromycin esterase|nr:erythromycin esterase family protein [Cytophagales bacterium]MCA6389356.1 erythromycin esterase family protein [Cytophagales bacterium]MCA6391821.1 erythromycin esterase family protein [Cytophagales bacterium]MCA6396091.1 erythromycin esterase family protein [Cytophagales bacterium]MCA6403345.1 erythromycin esterase family protein [Cytophagales bacterium]
MKKIKIYRKLKVALTFLFCLHASISGYSQIPTISDDWIGNNVHEMDIDSRDNLGFLKKEIGDKRIVFLGEATHEDGATFEFRTKIVKFLMEEMDFDVVLFEAGMFDLMQANKEFQKTGDSESIKKALWGFWRTQQWQSFYSFIEQRKAAGNNIEFAGFDCKFSSAYGFDNNNYSRFWEAIFQERNPAILMNENFTNYIAVWKDIESGYKQTGMKGALAKMRYKMSEKEKQSFRNLSSWMADELKKAGENKLAQLLRSNDEGIIAYSDTRLWKLILNRKSFLPINYRRDELMADNLRHLLSEVYPYKKVIVIGASYHFIRNNQTIDPIKINFIPVHEAVIAGNLIYEQFANEIYTIGFTSYDGEYGLIREGKKGVAVKKPEANSLEHQLSNRGVNQAFVSLRQSLNEPFFSNGTSLRLFDHSSHVTSKNWHQVLDAVYFIKTMQPLRD